MAVCPSCSAENREGARFCDTCGSALVEAAAPREQRKVVTVLFCDVTGSTALGERLDPESLRTLLARYFEHMKAIVERHGGTVEKFIGDAVMAVFGVPVVHEDDALRALRAAQDMRAAFPELGIEGRIGVMTGEVVTGTEERLATGDAVNVAARLEQAAGTGEILLGAETYALTRDAVEVEPVSALELKGKAEPVEAYRLLAAREEGEGFARRSDAPMVGRDTELRRLQDAFDQAVRDRSCQLFTILGTAGVGKSRLAAEFLGGLEGATVVRGRCLPYGEGITYWPVVEVVKQLGPREVDPQADAAIRGLLGKNGAPASASEIAWAFRKLLERAAEEQPLVCVFDDLHWGEETFLDLVEHVADLSREAPILLLCMSRPDLYDRRPSWGGGKLNATAVLLEPLGADEAGRLIDSLGDVGDELRARIRDAAEGNPLFLEQMIALVHDSGAGQIVVPATIQALLAARLDQLDPSERGVLEAGSVEGRLFHRGAVQALAPAENVPTRLTALVRKELVRPDKPQLPGEDAFRFRHLLIRDAAYESLPKAVRADLHEQFARWLEEHGRDLVELDEILGYHLEQAARYRAELGRPDEACAARARTLLATAGRRAGSRLDYGAAAAILERAVALIPDDDYDADLELDLVSALFLGGRTGEIGARLAALHERAARAGDRTVEIRARLNGEITRSYMDPAMDLGDLDRLAREVLPELQGTGDPLALYDAWNAITIVAHARLQSGEKLAAAERAIGYAKEAGDERRVAMQLPYLANARFYGPTPCAEGLAWIEQQRTGGVHHPAFDSHRAQFLAMLGRFEEARAIHEQDYARFEQFGIGVPLAISSSVRMDVEELAGDYEASYDWGRRGCELMETMGHLSWLSTMTAELGLVLCELDRYDEAASCAERSRELGADDDIATQIYWRELQSQILAARGESEAAEQFAREALALTRQTDNINGQAEALLCLGRVLARAGRQDRGDKALEEAIALFEQKGNVAMAEQTRGLL
jgi:class 3 adenylate cyclase/tetratricopeptide (TPR) repeat protein